VSRASIFSVSSSTAVGDVVDEQRQIGGFRDGLEMAADAFLRGPHVTWWRDEQAVRTQGREIPCLGDGGLGGEL